MRQAGGASPRRLVTQPGVRACAIREIRDTSSGVTLRWPYSTRLADASVGERQDDGRGQAPRRALTEQHFCVHEPTYVPNERRARGSHREDSSGSGTRLDLTRPGGLWARRKRKQASWTGPVSSVPRPFRVDSAGDRVDFFSELLFLETIIVPATPRW